MLRRVLLSISSYSFPPYIIALPSIFLIPILLFSINFSSNLRKLFFVSLSKKLVFKHILVRLQSNLMKIIHIKLCKKEIYLAHKWGKLWMSKVFRKDLAFKSFRLGNRKTWTIFCPTNYIRILLILVKIIYFQNLIGFYQKTGCT